MTNKNTRPPTSRDVARLAGVSQTAVSLVFTGRTGTRVSPATSARIRQAAQELGYSPNLNAAYLKSGRVRVLGLAVPTVMQPLYSSIFLAAERRARDLGYSVILLNSGNYVDWVGRITEMLRSNQLGGAVVFAPQSEEVKALSRTGLPVLYSDVPGINVPSGNFDIEGGMRLAADHLLALGHKRFAYLGVSTRRATFQARLDAFANYLEARGGSITAIARTDGFEFDDALKAASTLLESVSLFTAVACDDDMLAPAVIRAAGARGLIIPRDLSLVGVADIDLARMLTPSLTTVSLPVEEFSERAVALLVDQIEGGAPTRGFSLRTELVVRESSGPARRGHLRQDLMGTAQP